TALIAQKQYDEAKTMCRKELEHFPDNGSAHFALYALGVAQHDAGATARELAWTGAHADRSEMVFAQAEWSAFRGRPVEAAALFDEAARRLRAAGSVEAP